MVGVPGKSKGCHTCRRRKIKCDLGTPNCLRCTRSGRECEGYVRGPVFLNRTAQGLARRRHLEETQSRTGDAQSLVLGFGKNSLKPLKGAEQTGGSQWPDHEFDLCTKEYLLRNPSYLQVSAEGFFLETFVPFVSGGTPVTGEWLVHTFHVPGRAESLAKSLDALTITRLGRESHNQSMIMEGRKMYGQALQALQKALWDKDQVFHDQTLAAAQVLKMFELHESTQNSVSSFQSHVLGLIRLLAHRGPERNSTPLSRAITHDVRFAAMVNALQTRRRSPLGGSEWRPKAWLACADVEQSMYDKGFDTAALAEDMDKLAKTSTGQVADTPAARRCLQGLVGMREEMQRWHSWMLHHTSLATEWTDPLDGSGRPAQPYPLNSPDREHPRILYSKLRQAFLMMDYWAVIIVQEILASVLRSRLDDTATAAGVTGPVQAAARSEERQVRAARNIARTVPYCWSDEHGHNASMRCIFPLRVALFVGRATGGDAGRELEATCDGYLTTISRRKGFRHAYEIRRVSGGWGDTVLTRDPNDGSVRPAGSRSAPPENAFAAAQEAAVPAGMHYRGKS